MKEKTESTKTSNFATYASDDSALNGPKTGETEAKATHTTVLGKAFVFLLFPTLIGFIGLYIGYLETSRKDSTRELSFDQDFALPFALALAMCIVIGFQTGGFSKNKEPKPLVSWPKVRKKKKIIHKYVVKGQAKAQSDESTQLSKKDD